MLFRKFAVPIFAVFSLFASQSAEAQKKNAEERISQARLRVFIREDLSHRAETHVSVVKNGKETKLKFPKGKDLDGLRSGMVVNVRGKRDRSGAFTVGSTPSSFQVVTSPAAVGVGGTRQVIVLRIQSATAVTSATAAQIAPIMAQMDSWFQESSSGLLSIKNDRDANGVNDIFTVTIPDNSAGAAESLAFTYCNTAKSNAKTQLGIDPNLYDHIFCLIPPDMNYSWFGQAYLNGKDIVIDGQHAGGYPGGYTHELAHNLGMHHANSPTAEYGESGSVMGGNAGTAKRDFGGPHKLLMGWVPVKTAGAGTFELNAVELPVSQRSAPDTVLTMKDPVTNENLYISYRAPLGTFGPGLNVPYRTAIHTWPGGASRTVLLGTVGSGESFSRNGITVSQIAQAGSTATVSIGANCVAAAPQVSLAPAAFASNSGAAARYDITITNKDVNCSEPVTYSLAAAFPAGFSGSFASSTVTVAPGQSAATSLNTAPAAGTASGKFSIPVAISAANHPNGSSAASYTLDTQAPNAPTLQGSFRKNRASLSWNVPTDNLSAIARYRVFRNGVAVATVTSTSFSESMSTTTSYSVSAIDAAGNESPVSNSLTLSAGSKRR